MELFDILKARSGIPVDDPLAVLWVRNINGQQSNTVYLTADGKVYENEDSYVYALRKEISHGGN